MIMPVIEMPLHTEFRKEESPGTWADWNGSDFAAVFWSSLHRPQEEVLVSLIVHVAVAIGNTILTSPRHCPPQEFMVCPHIWFPDTPGEC